MAQLELKNSERFDAADLRRVGPGYASREEYPARKAETRDRVVVELERPYLRARDLVGGDGRTEDVPVTECVWPAPRS
jgi:hypothetical protein